MSVALFRRHGRYSVPLASVGDHLLELGLFGEGRELRACSRLVAREIVPGLSQLLGKQLQQFSLPE